MTGDRPADILLLGWDKGRDTAVDFTISSLCTLDQYPLSLEAGKNHLADAERSKLTRNGAACSAMR